jgi:hypothetical protein
MEARREGKDSSILRQHLYAIMPGGKEQLDAEVQDTGLSRRRAFENPILKKAQKFINAL